MYEDFIINLVISWISIFGIFICSLGSFSEKIFILVSLGLV